MHCKMLLRTDYTLLYMTKEYVASLIGLYKVLRNLNMYSFQKLYQVCIAYIIGATCNMASLTFFTSWSRPNFGHNMIPRLECSEVIVSKSMECLLDNIFYWFRDILEHIFNCYMVGEWLSAVKNTTGTVTLVMLHVLVGLTHGQW